MGDGGGGVVSGACDEDLPPRDESEAREFLMEGILAMRRTAIDLRRRAYKLDALSFELGAVLGADHLARLRLPDARPDP